MTRNHPPRRTCVGCRRVADADLLVRLSLDARGAIAIGPGPGRGAWLCGSPATARCLDEAVRRRGLERALRASITRHDLEGVRARLGCSSGA